MIKAHKKQIVIGLCVILGVLFVANCTVHLIRVITGHDHMMGLSPMFDFFMEANVPTWYSSFLLASSAAFLFVLYFVNQTRSERYYWLALAFMFVFLSLDELAQIHEFMGGVISRTKAQGLFPSEHSSSWVLAGGVMVAVVIGIFWKFWWGLTKDIRLLFFIAAFLFVGGSLGFEILQIYYVPLYGSDLGFSILVTIEETMEKSGIIIFIYALLKQIERTQSTITIQVC